MKLNKFNKLLKEEFEETINPIEIKEPNKKPKFEFKLRYAFMTVFAVLLVFLIVNHIAVSNYNNKIDNEIANFNYEELKLNTSKFDSKESLDKAIIKLPTQNSKKTSVLQGILSVFSGCQSRDTSSGYKIKYTSSYQTNVVEAGIDESDIAKSNGTYIFSACQNELYIYDLAGKEVLKKSFENEITGIYIYNDKVVVFTSQDINYILMEIFTFNNNSLIEEKEYASNIVQSRLYGNNLFIISKEYLDLNKVDYNNCYYDSSLNPNVLYRIFKINLDTLEEKEGDLVSNENNELYMSNNYIYFTTRNKCGSSFTNFFIIDLNLNGYAAFSQKGIALNKYSFSEYDGYFRYVLTDANAQICNSIYAYDLENKKLEGSLENQIGLEGERVKSVRFKDNKCYICTYRNTDPLYVIDLSDYKDIKILKELHVPGYSDYLHYFEINGIAYVLGVGRNEESFSKITIYKEENDDLIQVGKSFILAFSNTEKYITFDEYYYEFKDLNNNYYGYNSASINNNVIGYFFYNDSNYLYFGSPIANQHYAMFKIDVNNLNEPISVYYEYKTNKNTYYYIGIDYLRCFLINNKFYYFGDGSIIIEEF